MPVYLAFSSLVRFWQVLIGTDSITNLHKLEQVSSDEGIGTLAENLLEALREHPDVNKKIDAARRETRAEKKRMAMAMRQKALGTLGMTVQPRAPALPTRGPWHSRACLEVWELGSGMVKMQAGRWGVRHPARHSASEMRLSLFSSAEKTQRLNGSDLRNLRDGDNHC